MREFIIESIGKEMYVDKIGWLYSFDEYLELITDLESKARKTWPEGFETSGELKELIEQYRLNRTTQIPIGSRRG